MIIETVGFMGNTVGLMGNVDGVIWISRCHDDDYGPRGRYRRRKPGVSTSLFV